MTKLPLPILSPNGERYENGSIFRFDRTIQFYRR